MGQAKSNFGAIFIRTNRLEFGFRQIFCKVFKSELLQISREGPENWI